MSLPTGTSSLNSVTENGKQATPPVARKVPIVRKAGEVIKLIKKPDGVVSVSSSSSKEVSTTLVQPKLEWSKVPAPGLKNPLSTSFTIASAGREVQPDPNDEEMDDNSQEDDSTQDANNADHQYEGYSALDESGSVDVASISSKLSRIEQLLQKVVAKQEQHDADLKTLKFNIKDLRAELKSTGGTTKRPHYDNDKVPSSISRHPIPVKRERKRLVVFPVADDNYLLRLEDLVQADDEIRTDLITLFEAAPINSPYEFLRKNVQSLFVNTTKYTWTGKSIHHWPNAAPSNPAHKLAIVEVLISCASGKFPHLARDAIEKEFRRALANFNESRVVRLKRQSENPKTGTMTEVGEHSAGVIIS